MRRVTRQQLHVAPDKSRVHVASLWAQQRELGKQIPDPTLLPLFNLMWVPLKTQIQPEARPTVWSIWFNVLGHGAGCRRARCGVWKANRRCPAWPNWAPAHCFCSRAGGTSSSPSPLLLPSCSTFSTRVTQILTSPTESVHDLQSLSGQISGFETSPTWPLQRVNTRALGCSSAYEWVAHSCLTAANTKAAGLQNFQAKGDWVFLPWKLESSLVLFYDTHNLSINDPPGSMKHIGKWLHPSPPLFLLWSKSPSPASLRSSPNQSIAPLLPLSPKWFRAQHGSQGITWSKKLIKILLGSKASPGFPSQSSTGHKIFGMAQWAP